jgi:hypothetical protein
LRVIDVRWHRGPSACRPDASGFTISMISGLLQIRLPIRSRLNPARVDSSHSTCSRYGGQACRHRSLPVVTCRYRLDFFSCSRDCLLARC